MTRGSFRSGHRKWMWMAAAVVVRGCGRRRFRRLLHRGVLKVMLGICKRWKGVWALEILIDMVVIIGVNVLCCVCVYKMLERIIVINGERNVCFCS